MFYETYIEDRKCRMYSYNYELITSDHQLEPLQSAGLKETSIPLLKIEPDTEIPLSIVPEDGDFASRKDRQAHPVLRRPSENVRRLKH